MAPYGACEAEQSKAEAVLLNEKQGFMASKVSLDCFFERSAEQRCVVFVFLSFQRSGAANNCVFERIRWLRFSKEHCFRALSAPVQQITVFLSAKWLRCSK